MKREIRHNKNEGIENYFTPAGSTEERLQQIANKIEQSDKEREKLFRTDMKEGRKQYKRVNGKLWSL